VFQAITYVVDVYRKDAEPQKNFAHVLLYISLFPMLIAGPIVRFKDIASMIEGRKESLQGFISGVFRFSIGLGKKVILANFAGSVATSLLTNGLSTLTASGAWVGILMFAFQLYFDFSGYSDMAIGLGRIFGFEIKENFNYPYISRTVTEFWRRWHMSLSSFFRDYVYIPLGGNRKNQYFNLLVVWGLTGLWHGANWNFLLWGLYYAVLLIIERLLRKINIDLGKIPVVGNIVLILIVLYSWAIFYFVDLSQLGTFTLSMFGLNSVPIDLSLKESTAVFQYFWLIPLMAIGATPIPAKLGNRFVSSSGAVSIGIRTAWCIALLTVCCLLIMNQSFNPFLYFRF
jgi:alginate O-acetyltransferase complex protein AlgI